MILISSDLVGYSAHGYMHPWTDGCTLSPLSLSLMCYPECSWNNTEPQGHTGVRGEGDAELKDGDTWLEEEKLVLRRSKRQVSQHLPPEVKFAHAV